MLLTHLLLIDNLLQDPVISTIPECVCVCVHVRVHACSMCMENQKLRGRGRVRETAQSHPVS